MDAYALLRTFGALAIVLGLLFSALWLVRRFNLRLPGHTAGGALRRVELVERTVLDAKRSVALLRRDGREHLILLAPEGNLVIESAIRLDAADRKAQAEREVDAAARRREHEEALAAARAELTRRSRQFAAAAMSTAYRAGTLVKRMHVQRNSFAKLVNTRLSKAT